MKYVFFLKWIAAAIYTFMSNSRVLPLHLINTLFQSLQEHVWTVFIILIMNFTVQGDIKFLKKYCIPEIIERCSAEHKAFASQNIVVDNKVRSSKSGRVLLLRVFCCFLSMA